MNPGNKENNFYETQSSKKQKKKEKEKKGAYIKQRTFNKKCELIFLFIPLY